MDRNPDDSLSALLPLSGTDARAAAAVESEAGLEAEALHAGISPVDPSGTGLAELLRNAYPLMFIHLAATGMQFVDAWMAAQLGEEALAASLPGSILFFTIVCFGVGVLTMVNTFIAQSLGRNQKRDCGHYCFQGCLFSVAFGACMLLGLPFSSHVFDLFGHAPEVQVIEAAYFNVLLLAGLPYLVLTAISNFYAGIHRPMTLVWASALGTVLNVLFNYVLIFGKFGFPALGLPGAGWGTLLATLSQLVYLLLHYLSRPMREEFGTDQAQPDAAALRRLLYRGWPAGLQISSEMVVWSVALVFLVGLFGTVHLAATTIAVRVVHVAFLPAIGFGMAVTAAVGKGVGAGQHERVSRLTYQAFALILLYMGGIGLIMAYFPDSVLRLFTDNHEIISVGRNVFLCMALFQVFDAMNITFSHALRGAGDTAFPALATLLSCVILFLGGGILVVRFFPELESIGPWIMTDAYLLVLGISLWARWQFGPWRRINIFT